MRTTKTTRQPNDPMPSLRDALPRILLVLLALILSALPLAAQDDPPARFFIERIEVRNAKRVSTDIVISESRLSEGHDYSEAELQDASARLSRLPFLLSVDFSLEKGSERGRHVLVLTIQETKPFFFALGGTHYLEDETRLEVDYSERFTDTGNSSALGFRWFVGRRGAFHVGFAGQSGRSDEYSFEHAAFTAGYTQYDLFGTRAFATFNLKRPVDGTSIGAIVPELLVGIPLSPNQTLTLQVEETRNDRNVDIEGRRIFASRIAQRGVSARWSYNTTNNPFVPTRGTVLSIKPQLTWEDSSTLHDYIDFETQERVVASWTFHSRILSVEAGAERFWELSDRSSISAGLRGGLAHVDIRGNGVIPVGVDDPFEGETDAQFGSIGAGYTWSLWDRSRRQHGDSLIELSARYANRSDPGGGYRFGGRDVRQASLRWVRRSSWGTFRLGVGYAW